MRTSVVASVMALTGMVAAAPLEARAALTQVTNFRSNPSNTKMYIYVPSKLAAKPPVIVAIRTSRTKSAAGNDEDD